MRAFLSSALAYLFCLGLLFLGFKLYKWHNRVVIESNDDSMKPDYPPGNHALDVSANVVREIELGRAVAFRVPMLHDTLRVGWVLAREGQTVEIRNREILVDGAPSRRQPDEVRVKVGKFVVPRGCIFVMANEGGEDSAHYGPIPMRSIRGVLK